MSTFQIPSASSSDVAGALSTWNFPGTTISPSGTGSTITTQDSNDDLMNAALQSAGIYDSSSQPSVSSTTQPSLSSGGSVTPESTNPPSSSNSQFLDFLKNYGSDAAAIIIGLIIIAVSVAKLA